ncbi:MAG: tetratricopeptide repeat protein, partial [Verrucomicrobiota bacterium]
EARRLLAPFLATHPQSLPLLTAAAHAAAAAGQAGDAATLASRAIDLNPARAESHVALADARLADGRDRDAADLLARAVTLAPDNPALLLQLGDLLHHNLQDSAAALTRYEQALVLDPLHPPTLERVAGCRLELGRTDGVAALIERHLALAGPGPVVDQLRQRLAESIPAIPPAP